MTAAPAVVSKPFLAKRPVAVVADSAELPRHSPVQGCCRGGSTGEACTAATTDSSEPSGCGDEAGAESADEPPQRTAWSRRGWSSTAAFTIGKPPRAPRA